mgnify:CR=1 FL=1
MPLKSLCKELLDVRFDTATIADTCTYQTALHGQKLIFEKVGMYAFPKTVRSFTKGCRQFEMVFEFLEPRSRPGDEGWFFVGVCLRVATPSSCLSGDSWVLGFDGHIYSAGVTGSASPNPSHSFTARDVIGVALNCDVKPPVVSFYKDGTYVGSTRVKRHNVKYVDCGALCLCLCWCAGADVCWWAVCEWEKYVLFFPLAQLQL